MRRHCPCAPSRRPEHQEGVLDEHAVGHDQRLPVAGLDARRSPADLGHAARDLAHRDPVALRHRAVHLEGQAGHEVSEGVLEGEADDRGEHGRGGDQPRDVEARVRGDGEEGHDRGPGHEHVAQDLGDIEARLGQEQPEKKDRAEAGDGDGRREEEGHPDLRVGAVIDQPEMRGHGQEGEIEGEEEQGAAQAGALLGGTETDQEGSGEDSDHEPDRPLLAGLGDDGAPEAHRAALAEAAASSIRLSERTSAAVTGCPAKRPR